MELENNNNKLNVENTDTIDGLAYEQETSSLILLLADGMDWSDMNRHLLLLQEKLNNYIWYIDSKQYEEKYPDVKRIELRVSFLFQEPEICHKLLERAKQVLVDVFENVDLSKIQRIHTSIFTYHVDHGFQSLKPPVRLRLHFASNGLKRPRKIIMRNRIFGFMESGYNMQISKIVVRCDR